MFILYQDIDLILFLDLLFSALCLHLHLVRYKRVQFKLLVISSLWITQSSWKFLCDLQFSVLNVCKSFTSPNRPYVKLFGSLSLWPLEIIWIFWILIKSHTRPVFRLYLWFNARYPLITWLLYSYSGLQHLYQVGRWKLYYFLRYLLSTYRTLIPVY